MCTFKKKALFKEPGLEVFMSQIQDGNMRNRKTASQFFKQLGIDEANNFHIVPNVEVKDLNQFVEVNELVEGESCDGVLIRSPEYSVSIKPADCPIGIIYCPSKKVVMICHWGRLNLEADAVTKAISYMEQQLRTSSRYFKVYVTHAAQACSYTVYSMEGKSMQEIIKEALLQAGVSPKNISIGSKDTVKSPKYFSHSRFLRAEKLGILFRGEMNGSNLRIIEKESPIDPKEFNHLFSSGCIVEKNGLFFLDDAVLQLNKVKIAEGEKIHLVDGRSIVIARLV